MFAYETENGDIDPLTGELISESPKYSDLTPFNRKSNSIKPTNNSLVSPILQTRKYKKSNVKRRNRKVESTEYIEPLGPELMNSQLRYLEQTRFSSRKGEYGLDDSEEGIVVEFLESFSDYIKIYPDFCAYLYQEENRIWRRVSLKDTTKVGHFVANLYSPLVKQTLELPKFQNDEKLRKKVQKTINSLKRTNTRTSIGKFILSLSEGKAVGEDEELQDFNRKYPYLIPIKDNKCLDFRNLKLIERKPEHLFTYYVNRSYINDKARITKVNDFTKPYFKDEEGIDDNDTRLCFLKAIGYSITGLASTKSCFIVNGEKNCGKSTLFDLFQRAVGKDQVIRSISEKVFVNKSTTSDTSTELASIAQGLRFGYSSELKNNQRINSDQIKRLTGGDKMVARQLYQSEQQFRSICKLWVFTNFIPKFDVEDTALIERMVCFPFKHQFNVSITNNVVEEMYEDLDAVFSFMCLWAFKFIQENKNFKELSSERMLAFKEELVKDKDPLTNFWSNFSVIPNFDTLKKEEQFNLGMPHQTLFRYYTTYCEQSLIPEKDRYTSNTFSKRAVLLFKKVSDGIDKKVNGIRVRVLWGCRLATEEQ
jgi:P4 family phage/plasmid primase-like protien